MKISLEWIADYLPGALDPARAAEALTHGGLPVESIETVGQDTVLDVTNYVMFEMGQPLHPFDFDHLEGRRIVVRRARAGERLTSIDGKVRELNDTMLTIADAARPVALAGVMGGLDTEVTDRTVN